MPPLVPHYTATTAAVNCQQESWSWLKAHAQRQRDFIKFCRVVYGANGQPGESGVKL